MGYSILELVLQVLREAGFTADVAYPGQKVPRISDTVAAVHIEKVDRANLTVTLGISILAPASKGGTACEVDALRATEMLRWSGAVCVQNGCRYDGVAQVYVVEVLATFTGVTETDDCKIWPGFYVYINDRLQRYTVAFTDEEQTGATAEYAMGEAAPLGSHLGKQERALYLEELIPAGSPETAEPDGPFRLKLVTDQKTQLYSGCRWTSVRREFTKQGLRRIRRGFALSREEVTA